MSKQFSIKDKVCIITGAGKGIGRETSRLFYNEGARLALVTKDKSDLQSMKKELKFNDNRALLYDGDVSDENTVVEFVRETIDKYERIDVLINNAGMRFRKAFLDITTDEWCNVLNTNLNSVYFLCREIGRHMISQKNGRIINIASIIGTLGLPELAAYGASKGGIITLTKCLALEWAEYNINVNAIAPGFCETSYAENFKRNTELYNFTIDRTPLKKWGAPQDVANACLFLSSDAAKYITGEILNIDGGWSAW
jgi:NAD(P)-dependent dehydrogenase (short-subunit alcohol dehydrogenase family)